MDRYFRNPNELKGSRPRFESEPVEGRASVNQLGKVCPVERTWFDRLTTSARGTVWFGEGWLGQGGVETRPYGRPVGPVYLPSFIQSATRSAIMMVVALVLALMTSGITEASTTRRPSKPCT